MSEWADVEARKDQARIDANKIFIQCLRKMAKIAYGKIDVKPHPDNPLKATLGIYKDPRYNIRIECTLKETYKRYDYKNPPKDQYDRYQYSPLVGIGLEIVNYDKTKLCKSGQYYTKLGHITNRSPKLFLKKIGLLIEHIDNSIKTEDNNRTEEIQNQIKKAKFLSEIKGLVMDTTQDQYGLTKGYIGQHRLSQYTYDSICIRDNGEIRIQADVTPKQLNAITKYLGWRK